MRPQAGSALLVVLLSVGLLSAVALGLAHSSTVVRYAGANYDEAVSLAHASEAALELAARELALVADWNHVLRGTVVSSLVDGAPGPREVAPGTSLDLRTLTNQLTCGRTATCTDAQVRVMTRERPWGANNPRWRLFVHQLLPGPSLPASRPSAYVAVWIGDDARETDDDPLTDSAGAGQEGRYFVRARAEAFGARGARHAVDAELARVCAGDSETPRCAPGVRVHGSRPVVP